MTTARSTKSTLLAALELAVLAPSLHNTQPWLWRIGDRSAQLYLDESRKLPATDPQSRELIISCGAALHHLEVALSSMGWTSRVRRLPDPARPSFLAHVELSAPSASRDDDRALAEAIPRRRTDRRRFSSWPVPADLIGELTELATDRGLALHSITAPQLRWRLYRAIAEAAEQHAALPGQVAELAEWSGRDAEARDGVLAASVPRPQRVPGQPPMRAFARAELAQAPTPGEPESAALLLLSTPLDNPMQWLRAGELTSAVLLTATRDGLASSPLTQPLELTDTRQFLRMKITGSASSHPQILLRLGWPLLGAEELPRTPRRPLSEVVAPLDDWRGI